MFRCTDDLVLLRYVFYQRTNNVHERHVKPLTGIPKVKFAKMHGDMELATFTSTSRDPSVAMRFRGDDGGMFIKLQTLSLIHI